MAKSMRCDAVTKRRVVVVGKSMHMAGLAASLKANPALLVIRIDPDLPTTHQDITAFVPDVVIFDLVDPQDLSVSLLQDRPGLLLLGVDPSRDEMLVLSGRSERALSMQDLLQVVSRGAIAQPGEPKEELLSRGKSTIVHNLFQSKQTNFIEKENKMKNLPKRTKIALAIVGIVVVIAVVGLVITQTPAGELLGTTALVITPSNPTITEGSTVTLTANGVLCGMNSSDKTAVSIVFAQPSSITVKGLKSGTSSTITASCFGGVRASTTVTVGPPSFVRIINPTLNSTTLNGLSPNPYGLPTSATLNNGTGPATWSILSCVDDRNGYPLGNAINLSTTTGSSVDVTASEYQLTLAKCVVQASAGGATSQYTVCVNWDQGTPGCP